MDANPLHGDLPIHGFPSDLAITTTAEAGLRLLGDALDGHAAVAADRIESRRTRLGELRAQQHKRAEALLEQVRSEAAIHPAWLTHCLSEVKPNDAVVIREAPTMVLPMLSMTRPQTFLGAGASSGLGWGLGTAIGAKMAAPERLVIACEGDGSYMFGVPVAAHYVAMEQQAPFLTVIYNNRRWNEVRRATRSVFPTGNAAKSNSHEPLTYFDQSLLLYKAVETAGGHGEQVTDPAALPEALERAIGIVQEEGRQVVLDVICSE
jgi:acetolactate synthase-1/2/3 large subunit